MRRAKAKRLGGWLREAEEQLRSGVLSDSGTHLTIAELAVLLAAAQSEVRKGVLSEHLAMELWRVFAPTCDWDDMRGSQDIADGICSIVEQLVT